jgi:hypothetical protein
VTRYRLARAAILVVLALLLGIGCDAPTTPSPSPSAPAQAVPIERVSGDAEFLLTMRVGSARYRAGEPIDIAWTLTYRGPKDGIDALGSGSGLIGLSLAQLEGPLRIESAMSADCRPYRFLRGEAVPVPYRKSGAYSAADPNAAFYKAYFDDPVVRLPAGTWKLTAATEFATGEGCTPPWHRFRLEMTIVVEP